MKRLTIFFSVVVCGLLLATAVAFMQSDSRPRFGDEKNSEPRTAPPAALPQSHFNKNRLHKFMIKNQDAAIYDRLAKSKAIRRAIDYGSYRLVVVDEEAAGGRAALQAMLATPRDDQDMIVLNGFLIDTSNPQPLAKVLPSDLKQSRLSQALAGSAAPTQGLYIVQFIGPIQDPWLQTLQKTGVEIITYVPNNAYVVRADQRAAAELLTMKSNNSFVQWLGDYQPAYKLSPGLQAMRETADSQQVRVTVQVIGSASDLKADELRRSSLQYFGERQVLKYRNVTILSPVSRLAELAQSDEVFAIEEDHQRVRLDEAQGQIVAGNLAGNAPSGPGYLDWLASKGFNGSQFNSFSVNVVDDAYSLNGHPDLPDSRIAFQNNPTNESGTQGGHGFLNSHIIGGFNNGAGPAVEDARGFNYGLGIVPWARVGATAIFGPGFAFPSAWEETAYSQGARISSNSWGYDFEIYYSSHAQEYDSLVRDAQRGVSGNQQMTVVFAAGNDGSFGESTIAAPGTAKNVITVGASEGVRQTGADGCGIDNSGADSANDIIYFSSRGPVSSFIDGRIKPDIVAPGTHIQAGVPQSNYSGSSICEPYFPAGQTLYSWSSGTSHSTPAVAGGAALVYQDFLNKGMEAPSPAMTKAVLMNSASYLTGEGANDTLPSKSQGMGLMNLGRTFDHTPRLLVDQTKIFGSSGEIHRVFGTVAQSNQPFRVTLAWTDAPGPTVGAPWVNNLDLEVTVDGHTYFGNVFSGANSISGGAPDGKNNVESVFLPAGVSGNFVVTIRATNIAGDGLPGNDDLTDQDFALVVYNANSAVPNSPVIDFSPSILNFTAVAGSSNPPDQTVNISNIGVDTLNWTASSETSWLRVSPAGGAAPSTLTASIDISGLAAGTYNGSIVISATDAFNSPTRVPVTLTILPVFNVTPSIFSLYQVANGGNTASLPIDISNNDSVPRSWTASADVPWLTISPTSGTAPSTLNVFANVSGLAVGNYPATIKIVPDNVPDSPISVSVILVVLTPLDVFPTGLSVIAKFGGDNPPSQTLFINNIGSTAQSWTATSDSPWLTISPTSGTAPSRPVISFNISGLFLGSYNGVITITPTSAPDAKVIIQVNLMIDYFLNGVFEGTAAPWILSGAAQRSTGGYSHGGTGYLLMGASNSSSGSAYQQLTLPRGASPNLSFWLNVTSDETTTTAQNDKLFVEICNTSGRVLKTLATFSNLNKAGVGVYTQQGNYSLAGFAGQTVRVQFRTTANSSLLTTFRIDDVSVQ